MSSTLSYSHVITLGSAGSGKTTLLSSLLAYLKSVGNYAGEVKYNSLQTGVKEKKTQGVAFKNFAASYKIANANFLHLDCPTHEDTLKTLLVENAQWGTALLAIAVSDGFVPETEEQLRFAAKLGIPNLIVYISKCDFFPSEEEQELISMTEMQVKETLDSYNFKNVFWLRSPSVFDDTNPEMVEVMKRLAETISACYQPQRLIAYANPQLANDRLTLSGNFSKYHTDDYAVGKELEIASKGEAKNTVIVQATSPTSISVSLPRSINTSSKITLAAKGLLKVSHQFKAVCYFAKNKEGGQGVYFTTESYYFNFGEALNGRIGTANELSNSTELRTINEGSFLEVKVALQISVPLCEKMSFTVSNQERTIIHGIITEVLG